MLCRRFVDSFDCRLESIVCVSFLFYDNLVALLYDCFQSGFPDSIFKSFGLRNLYSLDSRLDIWQTLSPPAPDIFRNIDYSNMKGLKKQHSFFSALWENKAGSK